MKKMFAVVLMVALMVGMVAHAELRIELGDMHSTNVGTDENGETIWEDHFFAKVVSENGNVTTIEVSAAEWYELYRQWADEQIKEQRKADREAWMANVVRTITFWNPND